MTFPTACTSTPAHNAGASAYSRFVQRIRRRYAQQLPLLPEGAPLRPAMQATLDALLASGLETGAALRQLRQLVLERLVVLDCEMAPTLPTACGSLPPEGALRLRPGEAGSAALLDGKVSSPHAPHFVWFAAPAGWEVSPRRLLEGRFCILARRCGRYSIFRFCVFTTLRQAR